MFGARNLGHQDRAVRDGAPRRPPAEQFLVERAAEIRAAEVEPHDRVRHDDLPPLDGKDFTVAPLSKGPILAQGVAVLARCLMVARGQCTRNVGRGSRVCRLMTACRCLTCRAAAAAAPSATSLRVMGNIRLPGLAITFTRNSSHNQRKSQRRAPHLPRNGRGTTGTHPNR